MAVSLLAAAHVAAADPAGESPPSPLSLVVDAPLDCTDRGAFFAQIVTHTTRVREARPGEAARTMWVQIGAEPGGARGTLTVREVDGQQGHRTMGGADCKSVAGGLAFVAAIIIDPHAHLAADGPPPVVAQADVPPTPALPSDAAPHAAMQTQSAARPKGADSKPLSAARPKGADSLRTSEASLRGSAGAALAAASGLGPGIGIVPRVFVSAALGPVSARVSVGYGLPRNVVTADGTAEIRLADLRFEPCLLAWSPGALQVHGCALVEGVLLSGQGTSPPSGRTVRADSRTSAEVGLALRPMWALGPRAAVGALFGAAIPVTPRYRFYFEPDTAVYQLSAWSGLVEIDAGVRFW
jgi:hypothetical protein